MRNGEKMKYLSFPWERDIVPYMRKKRLLMGIYIIALLLTLKELRKRQASRRRRHRLLGSASASAFGFRFGQRLID